MSASAPAVSSDRFDLIVLGAGAAGMMCAAVAGQRGRRVVLIDHATELGEKIRISGGGRCNFTNINTGPQHFLSRNPHFCRSALARYTPRDFIDLMQRYRIGWHEKHKGQLFCDESSEDVIRMLDAECRAAGVEWRMPCKVERVEFESDTQRGKGYMLETSAGRIACDSLVIATGGLSIPKIGATDIGHRFARQFGLKVVEPRPALVPLTFDAATWAPYADLAGVSLTVGVSTQGEAYGPAQFTEDLLFTHRGLSGPAVLQISSFWEPGTPIDIDLLAGTNAAQALKDAKEGSRQSLVNALAALLPRRLAESWAAAAGFTSQQRLAEVSDRQLAALGASLNHWQLVPSGTEGFRKAEVTRGGVSTEELDQACLQAKRQPGLYFIGEVVDVTGWLGGYNFQWAWASAVAAGRVA
jgi:predicted Rossmann fold flavoprotein